MKRSEEGRVEELSKQVGGRFRLTTLIQKQAREYYMGGRAFMPSVRNFDELFNYILNEIEEGKIDLLLPGEDEEAEAAEQEGEE
ncbi:MAG: DNA-directed RNA polymerase subunit omega [Planctomycetota bacterium]|jgi:DNA-directed RNA polymerase subunit K/omega